MDCAQAAICLSRRSTMLFSLSNTVRTDQKLTRRSLISQTCTRRTSHTKIVPKDLTNTSSSPGKHIQQLFPHLNKFPALVTPRTLRFPTINTSVTGYSPRRKWVSTSSWITLWLVRYLKSTMSLQHCN